LTPPAQGNPSEFLN